MNSIVRENLLTVPGYAPYCGADNCRYDMPRTEWIPAIRQFVCKCGWVSEFPTEFIREYEKVKQQREDLKRYRTDIERIILGCRGVESRQVHIDEAAAMIAGYIHNEIEKVRQQNT